VSLTPLFGLCVVKLETKDALAELVHQRCPQHGINLVSLPTEESVDIWQLAQIESTSVSSALLVTSRESSELAVPGLSCLIATLISLTIDWVSESGGRAVSVTVDKLADAVTE